MTFNDITLHLILSSFLFSVTLELVLFKHLYISSQHVFSLFPVAAIQEGQGGPVLHSALSAPRDTGDPVC